jgi:hypothetical protein
VDEFPSTSSYVVVPDRLDVANLDTGQSIYLQVTHIDVHRGREILFYPFRQIRPSLYGAHLDAAAFLDVYCLIVLLPQKKAILSSYYWAFLISEKDSLLFSLLLDVLA